MISLGEYLRNLRLSKNLKIKFVAEQLSLDPSLLSKFERDERKPTSEQVAFLAAFYKVTEKKLSILLLSDKIAEELKYSTFTSEILKAAEEKILYKKKEIL